MGMKFDKLCHVKCLAPIKGHPFSLSFIKHQAWVLMEGEEQALKRPETTFLLTPSPWGEGLVGFTEEAKECYKPTRSTNGRREQETFQAGGGSPLLASTKLFRDRP